MKRTQLATSSPGTTKKSGTDRVKDTSQQSYGRLQGRSRLGTKATFVPGAAGLMRTVSLCSCPGFAHSMALNIPPANSVVERMTAKILLLHRPRTDPFPSG